MARTTKPLTNTEVKQAKLKAVMYTLSDGNGLQLRIKPNGSKIWLLDYRRPYTKVRTTLSFGPYPAVSLADARKKRSEARALLAKDIDPKEHRDDQARENAASGSNTLLHVAAQWLEIKKTKVSADHALDSWRSLELHIFPALGKVPIHKITALKSIEAIKPISAKGSLETVKRLCQRLNEVMTYAVNSGLIGANPLAGISNAFQNPAKQHQPTIAPDQLPALMKALSRASIKITTRCLIEWQLHTMVRPGEAAGTLWDEIDLNTRIWTIPAERMKRNKPHAVPLSDQAIELLDLMRPMSAHREFGSIRDSQRKFPRNSRAGCCGTALSYHRAVPAGGWAVGGLVRAEDGQPSLYATRGFQLVAAVHAQCTRSPIAAKSTDCPHAVRHLTRNGIHHADTLMQKPPKFCTLTFDGADTVTTAFRVR